MKKRVIIVGLDGATWDIIDKFIDRLPNIKRIINSGCRGTLISAIPCVTASAWPSAFTGVNPGKHGGFGFFKYTKTYEKIPTNSSDIKYPYLWELLSKKGLKTISVAVPLTYPVKKINGIMISGFTTPGTDCDFTYPKELKSKILRQFPNYHVDPPHAFEANPTEYRQDIFDIAEQNSELTKMLLKEIPDWDLFITVFSSTDWIQHYYLDEPDSLFRVYSTIDKFLAWFFENVYDENTTIILMSDHGFEEKTRVVNINRLLEEKGYLKTKKSATKSILASTGGLRSSLKKFDIFNLRRIMPYSIKEQIPTKKYDVVSIDLEKSAAWFPSTGGRGVFVKDKSLVDDLASLLSSLKDPKTNQNIFTHVWKRQDIYEGPYTEMAPDLLLHPKTGYEIVETYHNEWIIDVIWPDRIGTHNEKGIIAAMGGQVSNKKLDMYIWDIATTVLVLLGLPLYYDMDGEFKRDLFKENSDFYSKKAQYIPNVKTVAKKAIHLRKSRKKEQSPGNKI